MAWIDARIWCHPKITRLPNSAFRAYINGIAYSSGFRTGGILTHKMQLICSVNARDRSRLCSAGLWESAEELGRFCVRIHDWEEHNGERESRAEARKQADRERKRRQRARNLSAGQSAGQSADIPQDGPQEIHTLTDDYVTKEVPSGTSFTKRDDLWDALVAALGDVQTRTERSKRNGAVKQLRDIGASPLEVTPRVRRWSTMYPGATLTDTALVKHWSSLGAPIRSSAHRCSYCGVDASSGAALQDHLSNVHHHDWEAA